VKREFTAEWLYETIFDDDRVLHREVTDELRWADVVTFVFEAFGKLWAVDYYQGSTEHQPSGWEYGCDDPDTVEAVEVEPYEVTTTKYRPVEK
jgi:hypothetical protein